MLEIRLKVREAATRTEIRDKVKHSIEWYGEVLNITKCSSYIHFVQGIAVGMVYFYVYLMLSYVHVWSLSHHTLFTWKENLTFLIGKYYQDISQGFAQLMIQRLVVHGILGLQPDISHWKILPRYKSSFCSTYDPKASGSQHIRSTSGPWDYLSQLDWQNPYAETKAVSSFKIDLFNAQVKLTSSQRQAVSRTKNTKLLGTEQGPNMHNFAVAQN